MCYAQGENGSGAGAAWSLVIERVLCDPSDTSCPRLHAQLGEQSHVPSLEQPGHITAAKQTLAYLQVFLDQAVGLLKQFCLVALRVGWDAEVPEMRIRTLWGLPLGCCAYFSTALNFALFLPAVQALLDPGAASGQTDPVPHALICFASFPRCHRTAPALIS